MRTSDILLLSCIPKVGRATLRKAIAAAPAWHGADEESLVSFFEHLRAISTKVHVPSSHDLDVARTRLATVLEVHEKGDIRTISPLDSDFPERVKAIPDAPVLLHYRGNADSLHSDFVIAVIGTREVSTRGFQIGERLGHVLAQKGVTVVSGLAVGSDTAGHKGCVEAGGKAVAVLAGGLDKIYPRENMALAESILEQGGALVSEYMAGTAPQKNYFVERDRLQSGLSDAVVVLENGKVGGTMHTVKFATEQGRLLACLDPEKCALSPMAKVDGNRYILAELRAYGIGTNGDIDGILDELRAIKGMPSSRVSVGAEVDKKGQYKLFGE